MLLGALITTLGLGLSGCGESEPEVTARVSWDPALDDNNRGLLDLGTASLGEMIDGQITLTNISEDNLTVTIESALDAAMGFMASTPEDGIEVAPEEEFSWGPRLTALANSPAQPSGEVTFEYDDVTVVYEVIATVE
ncbi:MAG TPA: hypothetical protein DIU15_19890 [Deltaproteobacteria bacterium]|nr:hypothetical protein [Deltaproteobacteria bacterium]HCP48311.1 hypothetical protein [Deltaproteobacteria bacterium]